MGCAGRAQVRATVAIGQACEAVRRELEADAAAAAAAPPAVAGAAPCSVWE